jgi:hypothetical protein
MTIEKRKSFDYMLMIFSSYQTKKYCQTISNFVADNEDENLKECYVL